MDSERLYSKWITFDEQTSNELKGLTNKEIEDRFYKELTFGTGGIRGKVGAGTNRMNYYTVARVTKGVAKYLIDNYNKPFVVIAYDSRRYSLEFTRLCYRIFISYGIKVKMFKRPTPTPILSYAVRSLKASLGIVITASHNPKEYNGYKVYSEDGGQITTNTTNEIYSYICKEDYEYSGGYLLEERSKVTTSCIDYEYEYVDQHILDEYYNKVCNLSLNKEFVRKYADNIRIIYTPLHGTGGEAVGVVFNKLGFNNLLYVESQFKPSSEFETIRYPNPEEKEVFDLAIKLGREKLADILLASDPDCDRVGVMVRNNHGDYISLTGNEIGTLLTYYILTQLSSKGYIDKSYVVVKTIVTTDIVKDICWDFNVQMEEVLTGFKYIGEKIKDYEKENKKFIFGFEESYGYLAGDFVRDKDGVIASLLISEMALYYKSMNMNLLEVLDKIYKKYGYYKEELLSFVLDGKTGANTIKEIMNKVRNGSFLNDSGFGNFMITDYNDGIDSLPSEDVVSIENYKGKITIRPSGTEPKIKFYLAARSKTSLETLEYISEFRKYINNFMESVHNIED